MLKWKARSEAVVEHTRRLVPGESADTRELPDVLCMQEVDNFDSFFHGQLKSMGFGGISYKPRTARRKEKQDGSLVCFRLNRFELVQTNHLEFNDIADTIPNNLQVEDDENYWARDCVAAVCVVRDLIAGGLYVVASAHLYWDPKCADVKLAQAATLLKHVNDITRSLDNARGVLICGDFNSLANSAVVELLTKGVLNREHPDCSNTTPQVADYIDQILSECSVVSNLESSYSPNHSQISTLTPGFNGLLDYILYKSMREKHVLNSQPPLEATLELPTAKECLEAGLSALPSEQCPSDHFPIAALFHFNGCP